MISSVVFICELNNEALADLKESIGGLDPVCGWKRVSV